MRAAREPDLSVRRASICACSLSTTDRSSDARAYNCLARCEMLILVADTDTDDDAALAAPSLLVPEPAAAVLVWEIDQVV